MSLITTLVLVGLFAILGSGLRIAREYQRAVVFRLGRYNALRGPGLFWLIPLGIENETRIDLRIVTNPIEQQETITRDSVTVKVNAVLWFRVGDPKKAVLMVENFRSAVQQVALTSLRNVIGQHDLDGIGDDARIDTSLAAGAVPPPQGHSSACLTPCESRTGPARK